MSLKTKLKTTFFSLLLLTTCLLFLAVTPNIAKPAFAGTCSFTPTSIRQGGQITINSSGIGGLGSSTSFALVPGNYVVAPLNPLGITYGSVPSNAPVGTYGVQAQTTSFGITSTTDCSPVGGLTVTIGFTIDSNPTWSGNNVTFTWDKPANSAMTLIIIDQDDPTHPAVYDSSAAGVSINGLTKLTVSTDAWNVNRSIPIDGNFKVRLVAYGFTIVSNEVIFTIPGAGGGSGTCSFTPIGGSTYNLSAPQIVGNTVTFNFSPPASSNPYPPGLIVDTSPTFSNLTRPFDSGAIPTGQKSVVWNNAPQGVYCAVIVIGTLAYSNTIKFQIGGGYATWNNPGPAASPFNIMDVFQPAKRFGSFGQLASDVLLILVSLAGALALFFLVLSGVKLATSSGDEKKLASARATLTYAIIGIAVVILAFAIVKVLQYFLQSNVPIN